MHGYKVFPNSKESNFMNIAAFDITSNEEVNIQTYLGAGENIYASSEISMYRLQTIITA